MGGLNLKGGLGKLTNPKRKEKKSKCTYCLIKNKKEEKRRRRRRRGRSNGSNHGHHISCEPKASPYKFEKIERKSK